MPNEIQNLSLQGRAYEATHFLPNYSETYKYFGHLKDWPDRSEGIDLWKDFETRWREIPDVIVGNGSVDILTYVEKALYPHWDALASEDSTTADSEKQPITIPPDIQKRILDFLSSDAGISVWLKVSAPKLEEYFKNRDIANAIRAIGRLSIIGVAMPEENQDGDLMAPLFAETKKRVIYMGSRDLSLTYYGLGLLSYAESISPSLVETCVQQAKNFRALDHSLPRDGIRQFQGLVMMAVNGEAVEPELLADFERYLLTRMRNFTMGDWKGFDKALKILDDIEAVQPHRRLVRPGRPAAGVTHTLGAATPSRTGIPGEPS